jgi:hypothetical protein
MRTRLIKAATITLLTAVGGAGLALTATTPASALPCVDCEPGDGGGGGLPPQQPASCQPNTSATGNPVIEVSNSWLQAAHYQDTSGTYDRASNTIFALTHTWDNNWFGGFHAAPVVVLIDSCNNVVGGATPGSFGVSGTVEASLGYGPSDRLDPWSAPSGGPSSQQRAVRAIAIHKWVPQNQLGYILGEINSVLGQAVQIGQKVSTLVTLIQAL